MQLYIQLKEKSTAIEYRTAPRKNIYVIGKNGAGKSGWSNLIVGEKVFDAGIRTLYTTMVLQGVDVHVDKKHDFYLWDTRGLFDGSTIQGFMEDNFNYVVDANGFYSGVLFIFNGGAQPDESIDRFLQNALRHIGPHVKESFIAVVNVFNTSTLGRSGAYADKLHEHGFILKYDNFFISNAKQTPNQNAHMLRSQLDSFQAKLVRSHQTAYNKLLLELHGDVKEIIRHLHEHSRRELMLMLRHGRIDTSISKVQINSISKSKTQTIITVCRYSHGYLLGRL